MRLQYIMLPVHVLYITERVRVCVGLCGSAVCSFIQGVLNFLESLEI